MVAGFGGREAAVQADQSIVWKVITSEKIDILSVL
jgi:hypothetical protein